VQQFKECTQEDISHKLQRDLGLQSSTVDRAIAALVNRER
jgi:hypothetical protein